MPRDMKKLSDYSLEALERDSKLEYSFMGIVKALVFGQGDEVFDYKREDFVYGATCVTYFQGKEASRPSSSFKGSSLISPPCVEYKKHTHYFHTETGDELGTTRNEAAETANQIGVALLQERKFSDAKSYFSVAYNLCEKGYRNEEQFKRNIENAKEREEAEEREKDRMEEEERERLKRRLQGDNEKDVLHSGLVAEDVQRDDQKIGKLQKIVSEKVKNEWDKEEIEIEEKRKQMTAKMQFLELETP